MSEKELEQRALGLATLVCFYKHKTIPSYAVPDCLEVKFLTLYHVEDDPALRSIPFVRLTYKGRRAAELYYKSLKRARTWQGGEAVDMYLKHRDGDRTLFLMHPKRYMKELQAGQGDRLVKLYHMGFEGDWVRG